MGSASRHTFRRNQFLNAVLSACQELDPLPQVDKLLRAYEDTVVNYTLDEVVGMVEGVEVELPR